MKSVTLQEDVLHMLNFTGKSFFKRTVAFLTALYLMTATGCNQDESSTADLHTPSESTSSEDSGNTSHALNVSFEHAYKAEKLDIPDMQYANRISEFDGKLLISDENDQNQPYLYQLDDHSCTPVDLVYPASLDENADYAVSANFINAQNQPVFIYHASAYDVENIDQPYQDSGYTMEVYDTDFHLLETRDLNDVFPAETYFSAIVSDMDGNYYVAVLDNTTGSQKLTVYDKDFRQTAEISSDIQYIQQMALNGEGKLLLIYQDRQWNSCFGILNTETNSIDQIQIDSMPQWFSASCIGKKDYDLFVSDSISVYGVKISEGICEKVINWVNSDFNGDSISSMIQLEDGRFAVIENHSQDAYASSVWLLDERAPEEFENVQPISLSTLWLPSELSNAVSRFNRTHDDYRIAIINYDQYNTDEDHEAGLKQFKSDMTSGISADIICMSNMPYESYANKGLLLDLSEYIRQLNPDDYFMNFFDSLKYHDKLYQIGFSYSVNTLEAKTEHVNGKSGLSLPEFIDLMNQLPDTMTAFSDMSKTTALSELAIHCLPNFIDLHSSSCHFDSPEFIQVLELCNTYPDENTPDQSEDWSQDQWQQYWNDLDNEYIQDKTLFHSIYIYTIQQYLQERTAAFDQADVSMIGYPTNVEDSNGGRFQPEYTLSISANSAMKEQIWEFFQMMLDEDAQENLYSSLPVRKEAFDLFAKEAMNANTFITQTDIDTIKNHIENIHESMYSNEQIYNIIYEEAQAYFTGEKSAQDAADTIQSRVTLYLSE